MDVCSVVACTLTMLTPGRVQSLKDNDDTNDSSPDESSTVDITHVGLQYLQANLCVMCNVTHHFRCT
eukprot:scaffold4420_cov187-Amphora_coffeaeformis.AAC.7